MSKPSWSAGVERNSQPADTAPQRGPTWSLIRGWLLVVGLLVPSLASVWLMPGFVTQDGPCHLYNAWIVTRSLTSDADYAPYFDVHWRPLPNWSGHLVTAGLLLVTSPWIADRIVISVTAAGLAAALVWLRWRVRGAEGMASACLLSALLALNFLWLMGFSSFLFGCIAFTVTLGFWWTARDDLSAIRLVAISALLLVGYFSHLVSLGLTVLSLGLLALLAPPSSSSAGTFRSRLVRLGRTAACGIPLLALAPGYFWMARQGGPMAPVWENLADAASLSSWLGRLSWVDPLSLCRKTALPFTEWTAVYFVIFAPIAWLLLAGIVQLADFLRSTLGTARKLARSWTILGLALLFGGLLGPDSLGPGHGEYLPQRLTLLGLASLVPAIGATPCARAGRLTAAALAVGLSLQTLVIWDYAIQSDRTAGQIVRSRDLVGERQRIATLLIRTRSRFRANPLLHVDSWLGIGTGNILWSNYETRFYYFPVQFRPGIDRPDSSRLERLALGTDPETGPETVKSWRDLLATHGQAIDRILMWGFDPELEAITRSWGELVSVRGNCSVYARGPSR